MMKRMISAVILCAVMLCGAAQAEEAEAYSVSLIENQTTGYTWSYAISDDTVLSVADNGYQTEDSDDTLVGAAGTHSWAVSGLREGEASVTFTYAQEWNPQSTDPVVTFTFAADAGGALTLVSTDGMPEQYMADKMVIRLNANATTGYTWEAEADPEGILTFVSEAYEADETAADVAGAGGVYTCIYSAQASGTVVLTFRYVRSFEPEETPAKIVKLTYIVDSNLTVTLMGMDGDYDQYIP